MRLALALTMGLALAACSRAQSAETTADVRCLVSISRLVELNKQSRQFDDQVAETTTILGSMYYMGKLTGREPKLDVENAMVAEITRMSGQQLRSELVRCGGEMKTMGQHWNEIGKALVRRGQEMLEQEKAKAATPGRT